MRVTLTIATLLFGAGLCEGQEPVQYIEPPAPAAAETVSGSPSINQLARDNESLRAELHALRAEVDSLAEQVVQQRETEPLAVFFDNAAFQKGDYQIVPYGIGWVNLAFDTSRTRTGAFTIFAQSRDVEGESAFSVNARSSRFGTRVTGPEVFGGKTTGRVEFDFFGSAQTENRAGILLRHAFGEFVGENWRAVGGQTSDVISPLIPNMQNFTPGWGAGNIGYRRAQSRFEWWQDFADAGRFSLQGSINQTIVTDFATDPLTGGEDAGWPTLMGRIAFRPEWSAHQCDSSPAGCRPRPGYLAPGTGLRPELGISGHIGREQVDFTTPPLEDDRQFTSWSLNVDLYLPLTEDFGVQGEFFWGNVLGTFQGGIIQGIDPVLRRGIRSTGGWGEVWYQVTDRVHTHAGFGIDDPSNSNLSVGRRSQNHFWFGNAVFDVTELFSVGLEVSYWQTRFVGLSDGEAVRIETVMKYRF
ncbi:MAG: hypothetical protein ACYTGL_15930 [Planctomycetota bacterium]